MRIVALTPDLGDRTRIQGMAEGVQFVGAAAQLVTKADGADLVVVDLTRPGVLDVLPEVVATARRVVAYGPHVAADLLAAASAAGAETFPRSRFFTSGRRLID